jgi:hypothetical protein
MAGPRDRPGRLRVQYQCRSYFPARGLSTMLAALQMPKWRQCVDDSPSAPSVASARDATSNRGKGGWQPPNWRGRISTVTSSSVDRAKHTAHTHILHLRCARAHLSPFTRRHNFFFSSWQLKFCCLQPFFFFFGFHTTQAVTVSVCGHD